MSRKPKSVTEQELVDAILQMIVDRFARDVLAVGRKTVTMPGNDLSPLVNDRRRLWR